jgi:hypothetical protein
MPTAETRRAVANSKPDGYNLLKLFASYSFGTDRATNTITARLDNATDELYRNHLNYLKDLLPEVGRSLGNWPQRGPDRVEVDEDGGPERLEGRFSRPEVAALAPSVAVDDDRAAARFAAWCA